MIFDIEELDEVGKDICSSCSILLAHDNTTDGCNDPLGCGAFSNDSEYEYDVEDDILLEELNFDE